MELGGEVVKDLYYFLLGCYFFLVCVGVLDEDFQLLGQYLCLFICCCYVFCDVGYI